MDYRFAFGEHLSQIHVLDRLPSLETILEDGGAAASGALLVCDRNTEYLARAILGSQDRPLCVLEPGEARKGWASVERILEAAKQAGLGRDGLFVGIGGGVVTDMAAFAASVYMRGTRLSLVSTTLLGMADAAVGGKTGFDLLGMKNLVGTFFPAAHAYLPLEALETLPPAEWKSGMAELIKTAILDSGDINENGSSLNQVKALAPFMRDVFDGKGMGPRSFADGASPALAGLIARSVLVKGRIVEADPQESESGSGRALLNLGHTFGHALESAAGLGSLSHGEAVAWGMARACELGRALGITPESRAREIADAIAAYGYETAAPHPLMKDPAVFMSALSGDKKKRAGKLSFVVPAAEGAVVASEASMPPGLLERLITGDWAG